MKQLIILLTFLGIACTTQAQDNTFKLSSSSFQKTYSQTPLVIEVKNERKSPTIKLPKVANTIWKFHPETVNYYNNHSANSLCFNQSNGWKMIQVRPMKHQVAYDAAAIGTGIVIGSILEALGKL